MEIFKNTGEKIKKLFRDNHNKKAALIFALGAIGIILILLSEMIPEKEAENEAGKSVFSSELSGREAVLEERIAEAVSKINGAGKTHVTITFDSSEEYVFAENFSENNAESETERESELVIIEGEKGDLPVTIRTNEAKIRGVLIICEGGKNPLVKEKIIEGVCALLDIPSNKISVAEMAR